MKLYFDLCCYSRFYDDQGQLKIYVESEAVLNIINMTKQKNDEIYGSPALDLKIDQIDDFVENNNIDILLTTDARFEKACSKIDINTKVINPIKYLMEVIHNDSDI